MSASIVARRALTSRFFSTSARRMAATEEKASAETGNSQAMLLTGVTAVGLTAAFFWMRQTPKVGEEAPWDEATLAQHKAVKEAPSALNSVVIPNMTLPKDVHDRLNKWGKDGYP